jgi:hypothetical protein
MVDDENVNRALWDISFKPSCSTAGKIRGVSPNPINACPGTVDAPVDH